MNLSLYCKINSKVTYAVTVTVFNVSFKQAKAILNRQMYAMSMKIIRLYF